MSVYWRKILFSNCGFCSSFASFSEDGGRIFEHLGQDCTVILLLFLHIWVLPLKSKTFKTQAAGTRPVMRARTAEGKGVPHWGECTQASGCLSRSLRREKAHLIQGERAQASGCLNRSGRGRHKMQVQLNPRFCGVPENWNCTQHRARSI